MAFKVISGPMPFQGAYIFEAVNGSTRFVYEVTTETSGLSRLFDPLVSRQVRSQGEKQMAALKKVLEADAWYALKP